MKEIEKAILRQIEDMGMASEVELQAKSLLVLSELENSLKSLEMKGLVRRKPGVLGKMGDGYELTPKGYKTRD